MAEEALSELVEEEQLDAQEQLDGVCLVSQKALLSVEEQVEAVLWNDQK